MNKIVFEIKSRLKYHKECSVKCKRTLNLLKLWAALKDECDCGSDDLRDLITYKDDVYTGYFIMVDKHYKVLFEFLDNAYKDFDREYVVFARKKDFFHYHRAIPENIGIICTGNIYNFGNVFKTIREPILKKH